MPRALITGASGFIGQHLARELLANGWTVAGTTWSRPAPVPGLQAFRVDLGDTPTLTRIVEDVQPETVFHLGAIVDTVTTPDVVRLYDVNVLGTVRVLEALRGARIRPVVVFASSAFVYGAGVERQPIVESERLQPTTAYGASKAAAESIVEQFARETGTGVIVTRAFQQTGPGHVGTYALSNWAEQIARAVVTGAAEPLRCGNLDVARDYLDVRDVAAAYRALAELGRPGETYNIASGVPRTMRSLLDGLIDAAGVTIPIEVDASRIRGVEQQVFYGDTTKLRSDTGWLPRIPMAQTLSDLLAFWRDRIGNSSTASD